MAEIEVNSAFKQARMQRQKRKRQALMIRVWIGGGAALTLLLVAAGVVVFGGFWNAWFNSYDDEMLIPVGGDIIGGPTYVAPIIGLAGQPMRISLGSGAGSVAVREVRAPPQLPPERAPGQVSVLSDIMIAKSQQFMTTLPSSPKDFAFYQSQQVQPAAAPVSAPAAEVTVSSAGADVVNTIENTTSIATVRPESERFPPINDYAAQLLRDQSLQSVMAENNFAAADADVFARAMMEIVGRSDLYTGEIVAIRGLRTGRGNTPARVVQISLYDQDRSYIKSLSRSDDGAVVESADPWLNQPFKLPGEDQVVNSQRQYRLLDAIYSTASRNAVPTSVTGEAIRLLSLSHDLNAFASDEDELILAYASDADDGAVGRILYIAVHGPSRSIECYVFKLPADGDYSCFSERSRSASISMPAGMVSPVRGILVSAFGPGVSPITREVFTNPGIDWAATEGTPVVAAFSGSVSATENAEDAGNVVRISHSDGRETTYGHLQQFGAGIAPGKQVRAGEVIGYVGTTGITNGPMLHFELRVNGQPTDPFQATGGGVGSDDIAVQTLVNQIVKVESGGVATAKNPLSSAFGLGQFINSTWIRMMNTYKPELAQSMPQAELLALRSDPTLAREMVANLAREGESYLRNRGHSISAGRLYLCHFLGAEGAAIVLSADPSADLRVVLGDGVINANPFLKEQNAAWVIDWAERKMSGARGAPPPVDPVVQSPEFRIYQAAIQQLMPSSPAPGVPGEEPGAPPPAPDTAMIESRPRFTVVSA